MIVILFWSKIWGCWMQVQWNIDVMSISQPETILPCHSLPLSLSVRFLYFYLSISNCVFVSISISLSLTVFVSIFIILLKHWFGKTVIVFVTKYIYLVMISLLLRSEYMTSCTICKLELMFRIVYHNRNI